MSNKMLQTFLTLLKQKQVKASTIVSFLENDDSSTDLGFDSLMGNIRAHGDDVLPDDIVELMEKLTQVAINQKKDQAEEKMNRAIVENSLTNYSEIVTSVPIDANDKTVINSYIGQDQSTSLEYFVLHCPTQKCSFRFGELDLELTPVDPIRFIDKAGDSRSISYKFQLKVVHSVNPVSLENTFSRIKLESIYHVIGMSFLKPSDVIISKETDRIFISLNTSTFFKNLAKSYDVHYNNVKRLDGTKLSDIPGIESCQIDSNGLILVPKLFYESALYIDGNINTRPFVWSPSGEVPSVSTSFNKYRISINPGREFTDKNLIKDAIFKLSDLLSSAGVENTLLDAKEGSKSYSLTINGHDNSDLSTKFILESKMSAALRSLVRANHLSYNNYLNVFSRGGAGNESYTFEYDVKDKTLVSSYVNSGTKFIIYFNRSAVTSVKDRDGSTTDIVNGITGRNNAKFNKTGAMIDTLQKNGYYLPIGNDRLPESKSDYIPTSFMPITFEKMDSYSRTKQTVTGVSFIPFGFVKYVSTDMNVDYYDSAFSIYGSDIDMIPIKVRRVLKLSNRIDKVKNIYQIVIESNVTPAFDGDQPLLSVRLDDTHFLSLFRSTSTVKLMTDSKWVYASDYIETIDIDVSSSDTTTSLSMLLNPGNEVIVSKRAILRYATETLGSSSSFTDILLDNIGEIFGSDDSVTLDVFCQFFISRDGERHFVVPGIPESFFKHLSTAAKQGIVNDNIVATINGILRIDDQSVVNFVRSVQVPVKMNEYPVYTTTMQIEISNSLNREIDQAVDSIYSSEDITGKTGSQIIDIASSYNGILRTIFERIGAVVGDGTLTTVGNISIRNRVIGELKTLASKPVLPSMIGRQIDINFLKEATKQLNSEIFVRLIKVINSELNADSYEDLIRTFLERGTDFGSEFVITTLSPYRYNITFETHLRDDIMSLDGSILPELGYQVLISDERRTSYEFGKQIYDHNIHAMFSYKPIKQRSVNDVIVDSLQQTNLYYTQLDGTNLKIDLSLVSLYGIPDTMEDETQFFVPFIYNGARLTVKSTTWTTELAFFKLLTKTVEVEFTSETDQSLVVKKACFDLVNLNSDNNEAIKSVVLCFDNVKRPYTREGVESHFFFTDDLMPSVLSATYNVNNSPFNENTFNEFIGDEVKIMIYPISPTIVKYSSTTFNPDEVKNVIKVYGKSHRNRITMSPNEYINLYNTLISDPNLYEDEFLSYGNIRSTVLITRNSKGIYTTTLGNLDTEARIAKGNVPYNPKHLKLDMSDIDQLSSLNNDELKSIEERILQGQIDIENQKRDEQNVKHNLGLILSTIRWNTKQVENYRFINNEQPIWYRFSSDSYFMAIAFFSGVKIYIASGDQYVFCSNLPHEGVSEIVFGNNNTCVTTQHSNADKPFSKLWLPASGILLDQKLDYYKVVNGDSANIKYISGTNNREKKNTKIEVKNNKVYYNSAEVQTAQPVFNHNVYFFSPNDEYMIFNDKGTFKVLSLLNISNKEKKYVKFTSLNGVPFDLTTKPIEIGVWLNNTMFMGFSYKSDSGKYIRTRIIIDITKQSIIQTELIPEVPTVMYGKSMITDSYTKIHPLYTYLIAEKDKIDTDANKNGVWLWDLYIELSQDDVTMLNFNTTTGLHSSYMLADGTAPIFTKGVDVDGQSICEYLTTILKIMVFDSIEDETGEHIQSIEWLGNTLFDRSRCKRGDTTHLQCIDGNYFAFQGSSIYIWTYKKTSSGAKQTDFSYFDVSGYQRMTFEDKHVAILISSKPCAGIIEGDQVQILPINLEQNVTFMKKDSDITSIVKPIKDNYNTEFFVDAEVSFETYIFDDVTNPVTLDSRPISSAMCLNRFKEYTTKSHSQSNNENYFTYGNFLIMCNGRTVKIVPKTVPIADKPDGLTAEWYKSQVEDTPTFWQNKEAEIMNYIEGAYAIFPTLKGKESGIVDTINMNYVKEIMATRNVNNFQLGLNTLREHRLNMNNITDEKLDTVINLIGEVFNIFKSVTYVNNPDTITSTVMDYWSNSYAKSTFTSIMMRTPDEKKREVYNKMIDVFSKYNGNNFLSYDAGLAFVKLRGIHTIKGIGGRIINKTFDEVNKTIDQQEKNFNALKYEVNPSTNLLSSGEYIDPNTMESIKIMRYLLKIPHIKYFVANVVTYGDYVGRITVLKEEMGRVIEMVRVNTKYDLFHAMERSQLIAKFKEYLIKKLSITSKIDEKNVNTDFFNCLTAKYETIPRPDYVHFNGSDYIIIGNTVYFNSYGHHEHVPLTDAEMEEYNRLSDDIDRLETALTVTDDMALTIANRQTMARKINELNKLAVKGNETFLLTDGDTVTTIGLEVYNVLGMKDVIQDVYNVIYSFLEKKTFKVIEDGFTISTILCLIDLKTPNKADYSTIEPYAKQFEAYMAESIGKKHDPVRIEQALADFKRTMETIENGINKFDSLNKLYDMLVEVFAKRFPESLYTVNSSISREWTEIIEKSNSEISPDSDKIFLDYNIPNIEEFYKFYSDSLKRGYYLSNGSYNRDVDEIKKRLLPVLWKYRQGVCGSLIPVLSFKITFQRPVTFKPIEMFIQRETDNLVFNYTMEDDRVKHDEKYGQVEVNLVDIISKFQNRCNQRYTDGKPGIVINDVTSHVVDVEAPIKRYSSFEEYEVFEEVSHKPTEEREMITKVVETETFVTELLMRPDGSSNISSRIMAPSYDRVVEYIKEDCDIIKDAVDSGVITLNDAISIIKRDLPNVDSDDRKTEIFSIDQYVVFLNYKYSLFNSNDYNYRTSRNYLVGVYRSRPQYSFDSTKILYMFNHLTPGLQFEKQNISMIYEDKPSTVVEETIDDSRKNISFGNIKPYSYDTRRLETPDGKPYIYVNDKGESFIYWYGNTMIDDLSRAYIISQRLSDRSTATYHYVKEAKSRNKEAKEKAHAMKMYSDYNNKEKTVEKREIIKSYVTEMVAHPTNGKIRLTEIIPERKLVYNKGYEDTEINDTFETDINGILTSWELQPEMDTKTFSSATVVPKEIKNHGTKTVVLSSYRVGRYTGSIVEVFETVDTKITCVANLVFQMFDIKAFDFIDSNIYIVGSVTCVEGVNVRIGMINLNNLSSTSEPVYLNYLEKEINLVNSHLTELSNVKIDTKDTTYITYDDGKTSYLVIINGDNHHVKKFNDEKIGKIGSMHTSTKNGYVALYFDKVNRTEVWNCDGSLYDNYDGECYWM